MVSLLNGTELFTELSLYVLNCKVKSTPRSHIAIAKYIVSGALTITSAIMIYKAIQTGRKRITQNMETSSNPDSLAKTTAIAEIAFRILVDIKQVAPPTALLEIAHALKNRNRGIIQTD